MRPTLWGLLLTAFLLAGCDQDDRASLAGPQRQGRYSGIGTFEAGQLWREMKGAPESQDAAQADLADDEHVIVVLDSRTGEIRQCGDHSGFCVAMNPWNGSAAAAPVKLEKHSADFEPDRKKGFSDRSAVANEQVPQR